MNKTKNYIIIALYVALASLLSIVETTLLPPLPYGIRIGLANVITIVALYHYSKKEALFINILRVFLTALLLGGLFNISFFISLTGALFSSFIYLICDKNTSSIYFISILSAIFHSIGQLFIVTILYQQIKMLSLLLLLTLMSLLSGIFTAIIAENILKRVKR